MPDSVQTVAVEPNTCTECKVAAVMLSRTMRQCPKCYVTWYVNHCWNCKTRVDSRVCVPDECSGWYICNCCGRSEMPGYQR